jgi:hypothetical protein
MSRVIGTINNQVFLLDFLLKKNINIHGIMMFYSKNKTVISNLTLVETNIYK